MSERNFPILLRIQFALNKFVCVGLDSELSQIPKAISQSKGKTNMGIADTIIAFNKKIVYATKELVCAYKINRAFYDVHGEEGIIALRDTIAYINDAAPTIPIILDAKYGDTANTNISYAKTAFDLLQADAVTVNPYVGKEALEPFLSRTEKGIFVLCLTSTKGEKGEREIQFLDGYEQHNAPLYLSVAKRVVRRWNHKKNCALVVSPRSAEELQKVRREVGAIPILVPGLDNKERSLKKFVQAGRDSKAGGAIMNFSRYILFSPKEPWSLEGVNRRTENLDKFISKNTNFQER